MILFLTSLSRSYVIAASLTLQQYWFLYSEILTCQSSITANLQSFQLKNIWKFPIIVDHWSHFSPWFDRGSVRNDQLVNIAVNHLLDSSLTVEWTLLTWLPVLGLKCAAVGQTDGQVRLSLKRHKVRDHDMRYSANMGKVCIIIIYNLRRLPAPSYTCPSWWTL